MRYLLFFEKLNTFKSDAASFTEIYNNYSNQNNANNLTGCSQDKHFFNL